MLTFFRKIRKGLVDSGQDRKPVSPLGKYMIYALGEIGLVVIGILIALQINNWNEEQKTKEEEVVFLKRLKSEFESNQALILGEIRKQENISDGLRSLLQVISPKPVDTSIDSFQNYMTALSHVPKYTPIRRNHHIYDFLR